jgi:hypothetical protein
MTSIQLVSQTPPGSSKVTTHMSNIHELTGTFTNYRCYRTDGNAFSNPQLMIPSRTNAIPDFSKTSPTSAIKLRRNLDPKSLSYDTIQHNATHILNNQCEVLSSVYNRMLRNMADKPYPSNIGLESRGFVVCHMRGLIQDQGAEWWV